MTDDSDLRLLVEPGDAYRPQLIGRHGIRYLTHYGASIQWETVVKLPSVENSLSGVKWLGWEWNGERHWFVENLG